MAERPKAADPDPEASGQLAGAGEADGNPEEAVAPEGVPGVLAQAASGARTLENPLSFERPIYEMEAKIGELRSLASSTHLDLNGEVTALEKRLRSVTRDVYDRLTPWERVNVARHQDRPVAQDYIDIMLDDFVELHGDRLFADDAAIVTGLGHIAPETSGKKRSGRSILFIAHRKGKTVQERLYCNFGCAHPEGYRKALEKMRFAERLGLPIVTLINTPGAYPGIGAEERGQARAIAHNIMEMFGIRVPILSVVIGEGGSGGALGIGVGDCVSIMEQAFYSVISPEGCAAILYKNSDKAPEAADALKLTAPDLEKLGVVDEVIGEPLGGAHRNPKQAIESVKTWVLDRLEELDRIPIESLLERRYEKFRLMGDVEEDPEGPVEEEEEGAGPEPTES